MADGSVYFECEGEKGIFEVYASDAVEPQYRVVDFRTADPGVKFGIVKIGMPRVLIKLLYCRCPSGWREGYDLTYVDGYSVDVSFKFSRNGSLEEMAVRIRLQ